MIRGVATISNFPLKNILRYEEGDTIKVINRRDWKFWKFETENTYITTRQETGSNKAAAILEMEDTGVHVTYHFVKNNDKWKLDVIEDEST
ncbi:hypothetical protein ABDD95_16995 [Mucilaginibacter sp. PAMB04274]|uniref:hypothetical protein n=1 Tax=Mucilaginibacter sp. PAMB04274 TaxID=3138568 RepID=UPI0031F62C6D